MRQETEYSIMEFRIKQAELWREDVRDIIGLTSVKMDTYLVVNAVQLGFVVMSFCEGRLAAGTPSWLIGCHTLSLAGAFMYLLMSVWLSMHAAVSAKSYETRLLTQAVRLPVPSWAQLEGARTYASSFEKVQSRQMLRVPFITGTQESVLHRGLPSESSGSPSGTSDARHIATPVPKWDGKDASLPEWDGTDASCDPWGLERRGDGIYELDGSLRVDPRQARHVQLVREAMKHWQSYDAFARVSMSMGTNQLVTALSYYVMGYVLVSNHGVVASWLAVSLFMAIAVCIISLDMSLTLTEFRVSAALVIAGPVLGIFTADQWTRKTEISDVCVKFLPPIVYAIHAVWLSWLLYISKVVEQTGGAKLPTGFRSILYVDVFGWIKTKIPKVDLPYTSGSGRACSVPRRDVYRSGSGPAMQAVQYQQRQPVPLRPEDLPGAAGAARLPVGVEDCDPSWFEPQSFVPQQDQSVDGGVLDDDLEFERRDPGLVPWLVFQGATCLLIVLWFASGGFVLLDSCGVHTLRVQPLLRENVDEEEHNAGWLLQTGEHVSAGEELPTDWPHENVRPFGLACHSDGTVASLSRFSLYEAQIDGTKKVHFRPMPHCEEVEGEALQDIALSCEGGPCEALVLHRQGQRLTKCKLSASNDANETALLQTGSPHVASSWLSEEDTDEGRPQEEIKSLAFARTCLKGTQSNGRCAYVETSERRIVEVERDVGDVGPEVLEQWFPTRVLQARPTASFIQQSASGGSLHPLGDKYLAVLQRDAQSLEVLNPQQGGRTVGRWPLPKNKHWDAMCTAGDHLFLMAKGPSPQLWRFKMPEELRPKDQPTQKHRRPIVDLVSDADSETLLRSDLSNRLSAFGPRSSLQHRLSVG
jgi:hypothetical protein